MKAKATIEIEDSIEKECKDYLLPLEDFTALKKIGEGVSGEVFLARYHGANAQITQTVAIKQFINKKKEQFEEELKNSIFLLGKSINIISFYGFAKHQDFRFIIVEPFHCTLSKKIRDTVCIFEKHVKIPQDLRFTTSKYILISPFSPVSDNFFYYDSHSALLRAITIDEDQHYDLLDLYASIRHEEKLTGAALECIEDITGHTPPKLDGLNEGQIKDILLQLTEVLVLLRHLRFVHSDLKPRNIGLKYLPGGKLVIKVFDFDLSFTLDEPKNSRGSPYYMAPEILKESCKAWQYHYILNPLIVNSSKSDIYAVGLIMWCLIFGKQEDPFFTPDIVDFMDLYQHVVINHGNEKLPFPDDVDELFKNLMQEVLATRPESRPDAESFHERLTFCFHNNRVRKSGTATPALSKPELLELEEEAVHITERVIQRAKQYIQIAKEMNPVSDELMWAIKKTLQLTNEAFDIAKLANKADPANSPTISKMLGTYGTFSQPKYVENADQKKVNHGLTGINRSV